MQGQAWTTTDGNGRERTGPIDACACSCPSASVAVRSRPFVFTLIELLVVVAIIAILASLLLPGLSRARSKAVRIACAANLRQVAVVMAMYAGDSDAFYPNYDFGALENHAWVRQACGMPGTLREYAGNPAVLYCPTSWYSAAKNWSDSDCDLGYTVFWARWEWNWTDNGGTEYQDRTTARFTLHSQRLGGSSRFSFSETNEPWLFNPAERLLSADTVIYRTNASGGRYMFFSHRLGGYNRNDHDVAGYPDVPSVVRYTVDGMNHLYEDGRVVWLPGDSAPNVVNAGVGGNNVVRALSPPQ